MALSSPARADSTEFWAWSTLAFCWTVSDSSDFWAVRSVAFHPVVIGDRAYLADAGRVFRFDLATGHVTLVYDIRRDDPFCLAGGGDLKLPVRYDADFTLTAAGKSLFARLGPAALFPAPVGNQAAPKRLSYLVCLDVAGDAAKVRWAKTPPVPDPSSFSNTDPVSRSATRGLPLRRSACRTVTMLKVLMRKASTASKSSLL